jgi:hypothetical protein
VVKCVEKVPCYVNDFDSQCEEKCEEEGEEKGEEEGEEKCEEEGEEKSEEEGESVDKFTTHGIILTRRDGV